MCVSSILHRFTMLGPPSDAAMKHLDDRGLKQKGEESGANRMGDAIREYLREVYNVDRAGENRPLGYI